MQVHWAYFDCTREDEEHLERCWAEAQPPLLTRLEAMDRQPVALHIAAARQEEAPHWHLQAVLYLPGQMLVREDSRADPAVALQNVVAGLMRGIDQSAGQPEKATLRREEWHRIVPLLERCRRERRSDVFFAWLAPLAGTLSAHVRRELRMHIRDARLAAGRVDPAEILDETLLQAYERFDRRPAQLRLDLWLLRLADDVLEQSCRPVAEASLDEPVDVPSEEPRESERDGWMEWVTTPETTELGELLPGLPTADRWDSLDMETKHVESDNLLGRLPRIQRQALVLNAVHGFSTAEIADFQDRAETDVISEIDEARRVIEQSYREEYLSELGEDLEASR